MVPPIIFATLCTWKEVENELVVFGLGGIIFAAGMLLRIWSQLHLHHRLKVKKILTTTGPYAYVRNPLYVANTMILVAATMIAELFWLAPLMLIYCAIIYNLVVRFEESRLIEKYGTAYKDYLAGVPRWLPRLKYVPEAVTVNRRFLLPSLKVELHNLLLLLPFIIKEMVIH